MPSRQPVVLQLHVLLLQLHVLLLQLQVLVLQFPAHVLFLQRRVIQRMLKSLQVSHDVALFAQPTPGPECRAEGMTEKRQPRQHYTV